MNKKRSTLNSQLFLRVQRATNLGSAFDSSDESNSEGAGILIKARTSLLSSHNRANHGPRVAGVSDSQVGDLGFQSAGDGGIRKAIMRTDDRWWDLRKDAYDRTTASKQLPQRV
jgi:hypothetical protein